MVLVFHCPDLIRLEARGDIGLHMIVSFYCLHQSRALQPYSRFNTALDFALTTVLRSKTGGSGIGSSMIATISAKKK
jgi:hypothetical protein